MLEWSACGTAGGGGGGWRVALSPQQNQRLTPRHKLGENVEKAVMLSSCFFCVSTQLIDGEVEQSEEEFSPDTTNPKWTKLGRPDFHTEL